MNLRGILFCAFLPLLISCGGSKKVQKEKSSKSVSADMAEMQSRKMKSLFIDAKSAQIAGKQEEAESIYKKIVAVDATCYACMYELSILNEEKRDLQEALSWSKKAKNGDPGNVFYQEQYTQSLFQSGQTDLAVEQITNLVKEHKTVRELYQKAIFYSIRNKDFDNAKMIAAFYDAQFGYGHRTFKLYDYVFKNAKDTSALKENYQKYSSKYAGNEKVQMEYADFLIQYGFYSDATAQINKVQGSQRLPLQLKLFQLSKDWQNYALSLNKLSEINDLDVLDKGVKYMVKAEDLKSFGVVGPLKILASKDPGYNPFLSYYLKQGDGKNDTELESLLVKQWQDGERSQELAKSLNEFYQNKSKWPQALEASTYLVENYPAFVESYIIHSNNLLKNGKYAEAYSYANQGDLYAVNNNEACKLLLNQAWSNFYLGKAENYSLDLQKAWVVIPENEAVMEELMMFSLLVKMQLDKVKANVEKKGSSLSKAVLPLMQFNGYKAAEWEKLVEKSKNSILLELAFHKAKEGDSTSFMEKWQSQLKEKYPQHRYYN